VCRPAHCTAAPHAGLLVAARAPGAAHLRPWCQHALQALQLGQQQPQDPPTSPGRPHPTPSPRPTTQDLGAADQTRKRGEGEDEGGRQLRSQSKAGSAGRQAGARRSAELDKAGSLESQKEMDALQVLCDLRGTA
jgi:hypothetical protein